MEIKDDVGILIKPYTETLRWEPYPNCRDGHNFPNPNPEPDPELPEPDIPDHYLG